MIKSQFGWDVSGVCAGDYGVAFPRQSRLCATQSAVKLHWELWDVLPLLKSMDLSMIEGSTDALSPVHLSCTLGFQLVFVSSLRSIQTLHDDNKDAHTARKGGRWLWRHNKEASVLDMRWISRSVNHYEVCTRPLLLLNIWENIILPAVTY